jgi:hypothetical protein
MEKPLATSRVDAGRDRGWTRSPLTAVCALFLLGIGPANASVLSPAVVSGSVFFNLSPPPRIDFNTFGTFSQVGPGGFVQFAASGMPGPFLSGQATISQGFTGRVSGILVYDIEILGPTGAVPVLIDVSGGAAGSSTTTDPFAAFALKSLWTLENVNLGLRPVFSEGIDTGSLTGIFNQNFSHTLSLTLTANHVYRVTMVADAFAGTGSSGTLAFGTAFIDPIFSFGVGVGPEYSFHISDGVGNSSIPEPSSLVLSSAGIVDLALFRRLVG